MTGRTSRIKYREGWPGVVEWRVGIGAVGILLADFEGEHDVAMMPILWGEVQGFNGVEDLLFFDRNGKKYNLKAHLKNGPSEVIWNTVNQF